MASKLIVLVLLYLAMLAVAQTFAESGINSSKNK